MQFLTFFPTNIAEIYLLFYSVQLGLKKAAFRIGKPLIFSNKNHHSSVKCFLLKICLHDTILQTTVLQGGVAEIPLEWR